MQRSCTDSTQGLCSLTSSCGRRPRTSRRLQGGLASRARRPLHDPSCSADRRCSPAQHSKHGDPAREKRWRSHRRST